MVIYMGELIVYFIIPALSFVCVTLSYLIVKWKQLDRKYMYLFPLFLIIFVFLGIVEFYMFVFFLCSCFYSIYSYYDHDEN